MFFVQHQGFWFQNRQLKKEKTTECFGQKGGCNKTGFFLSTSVLQNVKSYRFFCAPLLGKFWVMLKTHYKNRYFSTFLKAKKMKKWPFLIVTNWATLIVTNWATFAQLNKRQRGSLVTIKNCGSPFFLNKKTAETLNFIAFLTNSLFKKTNVAQLVTIKNPQMWPR